MATKLQKHFQEIKRVFFPRWDRENAWKITTRTKRNVCGYCDRDRRVIEIGDRHTDPDDRDLLLVHEICHAVTTGGHGNPWQARMEKAAIKAEAIGRGNLADLLRKEITRYQDANAVGVNSVRQCYLTIEDWVMEQPDLTLAQVKRIYAHENGMLLAEFDREFKRADKVFAKAKRKALEMQRIQDQWTQRER